MWKGEGRICSGSSSLSACLCHDSLKVYSCQVWWWRWQGCAACRQLGLLHTFSCLKILSCWAMLEWKVVSWYPFSYHRSKVLVTKTLKIKVKSPLVNKFSHSIQHTGTFKNDGDIYGVESVLVIAMCSSPLHFWPDKTEWRLISATLCGWRRCFMADQLWLMTRIREEEDLRYKRFWAGSEHTLQPSKEVTCKRATCSVNTNDILTVGMLGHSILREHFTPWHKLLVDFSGRSFELLRLGWIGWQIIYGISDTQKQKY